MRSRLKLMLSRARYAAMGAAVGAAAGGLISKNAASSGGALGALVGATIGEKRVSLDSLVEEVKERPRSDAEADD
jgi:osmotically inducible lipoprotein OsmB